MRNIKSSSIKEARRHAQKQSKHIFYTGTVLKYHVNSNGKDERILLITDLFVSYYSKKGENTNINYWIELNEFSFQNKDKNILINLKFDQNEKMKFECPSKSNVGQIILESIKHMSIRKDLKVEGVNPKFCFSVLPRTIFNIFISQVLRNNNDISKTLKKSIRMICRLHSKIIGFMPNMIEKYFPFLLNSIIYSNYIESLRIPELDKTDVFKCLSEYLQKESIADSTLFHIGIAKQDMKNFQLFCDSLSKYKSSNNKISAVTFVNTEFNKESVMILSKAINKSNGKGSYCINSLGFENATKTDVNFVQSFFPNSESLQNVNSPIKYLSISRMRIDNISNFISLLKGVRVLSLSYMNIEVSSIFQAISNTGMNDLNFLNVSGNFFNESSSYAKKLPSSLQRLDANEVNFYVQNPESENGNSMVDFYISVLNKKWNSLFYLSFSHISVHNNNEGAFSPDSSLKYLFSKLKKCKTASCEILKGLSFSGNYVNNEFFEFIKKCRNLRALFINYVFTVQSSNLDSFCEVLSDFLPNLNTLSVIGDLNNNKVIGEKFTLFCKALKKCKSLQCLIVSDNLIGSKGVEALSCLFDRNDRENNVSETLNSICFENCSVDSIQPLIELAEKAAATGRSVLLDYPTTEVWRLKEMRIANKEQIKELRKKFEIAYLTKNDKKSGSKIVSDEIKEINEYWEKPFSEYKVPVNDYFPEYLTPKLIGELNSPDKVNIDDRTERISKVKNKKSDSDSDGESDSDSDSESSSDDESERKSKKNKKMKNKKKSHASSESEEGSDDDEVDSSNKTSRKKHKKKINNSSDSEADEDESDEDDKNKKSKKTKSKKKSSDSESDEISDSSDDDDESDNKKKKKSIKKTKKKVTDTSSDDDYDPWKRNKNKTKRKYINSDDDESEEVQKKKKMNSKKSKRVFNESSDDDDDFDEDSFRSYKHSQSKRHKNSHKISESDSNSDYDDAIDFRKSSKRSSKAKNKNSKRKKSNKNDFDDDIENNQDFPLSISPKKEKEIMKDIKKKFSITRLQDMIINNY